MNLFERYPDGIARKYEGRLRQEVERVYNKLKPQQQSESQKILAELNNDNCVVLEGARTTVLRFEEVPHQSGGERYTHRPPAFLGFDDFRNFYLSRYINIGDDKSASGSGS